MEKNNKVNTENRRRTAAVPRAEGFLKGAHQPAQLPGGGFHGGRQTAQLPGGGFH